MNNNTNEQSGTTQENEISSGQQNESNIIKRKKSSEQVTNNIDELSVNDYLEVINNEYKSEREKRQSFEARATLIMTILAAICVFIFGNSDMKSSVYSISVEPLFIYNLIKLILIVIIYISFAYTMLTTLRSVWVTKYENIVFKDHKQLLRESRIIAKYKIFNSYMELLDNHREINKKRAINLKNAFIGLTILLISLMLYSLF